MDLQLSREYAGSKEAICDLQLKDDVKR